MCLPVKTPGTAGLLCIVYRETARPCKLSPTFSSFCMTAVWPMYCAVCQGLSPALFDASTCAHARQHRHGHITRC